MSFIVAASKGSRDSTVLDGVQALAVIALLTALMIVTITLLIGRGTTRFQPALFVGQAAVQGEPLLHSLPGAQLEQTSRAPRLLQGYLIVQPDTIAFVPIRKSREELGWSCPRASIARADVVASGGRAFVTFAFTDSSELEIWTTNPKRLKQALSEG